MFKSREVEELINIAHNLRSQFGSNPENTAAQVLAEGPSLCQSLAARPSSDVDVAELTEDLQQLCKAASFFVFCGLKQSSFRSFAVTHGLQLVEDRRALRLDALKKTISQHITADGTWKLFLKEQGLRNHHCTLLIDQIISPGLPTLQTIISGRSTLAPLYACADSVFSEQSTIPPGSVESSIAHAQDASRALALTLGVGPVETDVVLGLWLLDASIGFIVESPAHTATLQAGALRLLLPTLQHNLLGTPGILNCALLFLLCGNANASLVMLEQRPREQKLALATAMAMIECGRTFEAFELQDEIANYSVIRHMCFTRLWQQKEHWRLVCLGQTSDHLVGFLTGLIQSDTEQHIDVAVDLLVAHFLNNSQVLDALFVHLEYASSPHAVPSNHLGSRQALIDSALHLLPPHVLGTFKASGIAPAAIAMGVTLAPSPFDRRRTTATGDFDGVTDVYQEHFAQPSSSQRAPPKVAHFSGSIAQEAMLRQAAFVASAAPRHSTLGQNELEGGGSANTQSAATEGVMSPGRLFSGISGRVASRKRNTQRKTINSPAPVANNKVTTAVAPVDIFGNVPGRLTRSRTRTTGKAP